MQNGLSAVYLIKKKKLKTFTFILKINSAACVRVFCKYICFEPRTKKAILARLPNINFSNK